MGYLTTLTVYNDGIDLLPDNAQKFAEGVLNASRSAGLDHKPVTLGVGMFANLVKVQVPRHANHQTLYVHMGNTVIEMDPYSKEAKELLERNPEFFEKAVKFIEYQAKDLRAMLKRAKVK